MAPESINRVSSGSPLSKPSEGIVDKFLDAIWMERGLSANTLGAYRADLVSLRRWLAERDVRRIMAGGIHVLGLRLGVGGLKAHHTTCHDGNQKEQPPDGTGGTQTGNKREHDFLNKAAAPFPAKRKDVLCRREFKRRLFE